MYSTRPWPGHSNEIRTRGGQCPLVRNPISVVRVLIEQPEGERKLFYDLNTKKGSKIQAEWVRCEVE